MADPHALLTGQTWWPELDPTGQVLAAEALSLLIVYGPGRESNAVLALAGHVLARTAGEQVALSAAVVDWQRRLQQLAGPVAASPPVERAPAGECACGANGAGHQRCGA